MSAVIYTKDLDNIIPKMKVIPPPPNRLIPSLLDIKHIYTLDCDYYHEEFGDIFTLARTVINKGIDPNLEILRDGERTGERPIDLVAI